MSETKPWTTPVVFATAIIAPMAAVTALALAGALTPETAPGIPVPAAAIRWGIPISAGLRDVATAISLGSLVALCVCLPARNARTSWHDSPPGWNRLASVVSLTAWIWVCAGVTNLVLTYADLSGYGPGSAELWSTLDYFTLEFEIGQYYALNALAGCTVALAASWVRSTSGAGVLAVIALAGLWPIALTGHAAGALDHDMAVNSQALHLAGSSMWMGGLVALVCAAPLLGAKLPGTVRHYSTLALWCFCLVTFSSVVNSVIRIESWSLLATAYGAILFLKVLALTLLMTAGAWQRRRVIHALEDGKSKAFRWLALSEALIMAVAMGLGVALGRMEPPTGYRQPLETVESLIYFTLPGPIGWPGWVTTWRPDTLWGPVAVVAVGMYVRGVVKLHRRGDSWPVGRTVAWCIGWALLTWATSGAPAVYGKAMFSMHMVQHMTFATAVPVFLALAGPVTLLLRAATRRQDGSYGPREWVLRVIHSTYVRVLGLPLVAAALFVGSLAAFYYSGLFEWSLRSHTAHVFMVVHFLLVGYLFANSVVGIDPGQKRPSYPLRALLVMMVFGYHSLFSVSLMGNERILAGEWFTLVQPAWVTSLADDQYLGAAIGWGMGEYPLAIIVGALFWQWFRADTAEQRRYDRKAARDGGEDLAGYNDYLETLRQHHAKRN